MSRYRFCLIVLCLGAGLAACGDEDALRQQVQELEGQRAELVTMNEKLKMENEDLQATTLELQTEVASLREALMPRDSAALAPAGLVPPAAMPAATPVGTRPANPAAAAPVAVPVAPSRR